MRRAVRSLAARPWFSVAAIASLAFGIGANATVFTIVNALLFRPLPYRDADRLVFGRSENARLGVTGGTVSIAELELVRGQVRSLTGAGLVREGDFNVTLGERPRRLRGAIVSATTLPTLGVVPARGTAFGATNDVTGSPSRVLISDGLWRSALGAAPDVAGATLRIDGATFEIAGVMPPGFRFPEQTDLWIPIGAAGATAAGVAGRDARMFQLVARLSPDATISGARAELQTIARRADDARPTANRGWTLTVISAERERGENARPAVYLLFALVTCVLLVACANLASLLSARAAGRHRELAIRSALGASHARLIWHGLTESIVLAAIGGGLALVVAVLGVRAVRLAFPADTLPFWLRFELDWRVLVYALGLSIATALAFGLAPAVWSARRAPAAGLLSGSRSSTGGVRRGRLTGALIAGQVAVSLVLLVAASLLGAALRSIGTADLGYEPAGLVTTDIEPRSKGYATDEASRRALYASLADNIRAIPGVTSASGFDLWGGAPLELAGSSGAAVRRVESTVYSVLPAYVETLRARVVAGRPLAAGDNAGAPRVAVVNETFASRHWPNEPAVGRQVRVASGTARDVWLTVVGVVGDVRRNPADLEREAHLYVAALQFPPRRLRLVARTDGAPVTVAAFEGAARGADPDEPLGPLLTMPEQIAQWTAPSRFFATSLGGFAVVAVLIAMTGVFGVVSGVVASRTREFGIRLALGATTRHVVTLALGRGARLALAGAAVGLVGAAMVARVIVTLPFGVERVDLSIVASAPLASSQSRCWRPMRRPGARRAWSRPSR